MTFKTFRLIPILIISCVPAYADKAAAENSTMPPFPTAHASDPIRAIEGTEMEIRQRSPESVENRQTALETQRFQVKFNALSNAVRDFATKYNDSRGQVWPMREANALRKAIDDMQHEPALPGSKNNKGAK